MALHFRRVVIESASGLVPHARAQLVLAGRVYDGVERSVEQRWERRDGGEGAIERWAVERDGTTVYEIWALGGDAGTVFFAGGERAVGHVCQFGFTAPDEPAAWAELADALADPGSWPASIDFSLPDDDV